MKNAETLKIIALADRELVITRVFNAPRELVFEALTKPDLVKRWLIGPPGWSLPVCDIDLKVGGAYRYVWRNESGTEMGAGGVYREIARPERIVHTERFDQPWYPGEAVLTTRLVEQGGRTTLSFTILYESQAARDGVLKSPMESGLSYSYNRLEELLGSLQAGRG